MLKELLSHLATDRSWRLAELSQRLGVSEGMVEQLLWELESRGYIERHAANEQGECCAPKHCAACTACGPSDAAAVVWTLTEKGRLKAA